MHRENEVHSANSGRTNYRSNRTKKIVILLMLAILAVAGILAFIVFGNPFRSGGGMDVSLKNPLGVKVTQNAQKVTVTADKHVSSSANAYIVDLYSGGGSDIHLNRRFAEARRGSGEVSYDNLNPGEQYVIVVTECRRSKKGYKEIKKPAASLIKVLPLETGIAVYGDASSSGGSDDNGNSAGSGGSDDKGGTAGSGEPDDKGKSAGSGAGKSDLENRQMSAGDFQNEAKETDDKVQGKVYPDKEKIRRILENAAIDRKKGISFYYPKKVPDFAFTDGSLLLDDEISSIAYTWYYYNDKNDYDQQITIMGKEYYRYDFHFDYHYSRTKQKRYLPKILEIRKRLTGTDAEKVKKFDAYFRKNCVYDDSLTKGDPYDAIVGGEAVCDGYARAAYLLMNMAGAPCEYIYGRGNGGGGWESHAWNMNKIGSKWYQSDFTWDSSLGNTSFLLKGSGNKKFNRMHVKAGKFKKEKWVKEHPMSKKDY